METTQGYPDPYCGEAKMLGGGRQTSRQRLEMLKAQLEAKLSEVNEAIAALDSNPEFEKVHNILNRALNY